MQRFSRLFGCLSKGGLGIFVALSSIFLTAQTFASSTNFESELQRLTTRDYDQVSIAVANIGDSGDERAVDVLNLLLAGDIYFDKDSKQLVKIVEKQGSKYLVTPLFAAESTPAQQVKRRSVKKVGINNLLRGEIKLQLAALNIRHPDEQKRIDAVTQLMGELDAQSYAMLQQARSTETDSDVQQVLDTALAIYQLEHSSTQDEQLAAIATLGDSYQPTARNALTQILSTNPNKTLTEATNKALGLIEQRVSMAQFGETLFFGLSLGSVLVLAAIGLAITFGVMGIINMAHGELIMLGAYTTYVIQTLMPNHIGWSIIVSIPVAFLVSGAVGVLIERTVIRHLYGRPLETLLATFGISLVLQQAVRTIFSPLNRSVSTPEWMQGVIEINPLLSLTLNRFYIIIFCLIVFAMLFAVLRYTRLGIEVRAVSQNRSMARSMGVKSEWVDAMTFGLGSGIAGIAGVALSQLTNVGPNLGQAYIIDSFMVVVFGGVGNLWGTLVAGMSLGIANKVMEPWAGAVLAKILVLVFIILFIQKKPRGLFPQKGRSAEG
ncbi:urea ABC transporter permease subunit UrtB [Vibrio cholerae]|uniref:urea ABC transporter permease subunit UrtB n=1 Tax=Vibrio cholerae TaxID=666 RepID=UPI00247A67D8|nr:urea ABC transporter permease subunit UrtB [Vibrio cholerae]EJK2098949.1 urea ABC transporter permease subunit UrtB [Vibrio cholerae]EKF9435930.1 urea ABC transporter permease subunit UrtB [Vibrio cholerae]EKF9604846.1 urea ABC transporter permease subunit UrtB [Vibrio cholerae]MDH7616676.1 urea ABC transporter permease subunit UrtB [Vibrio cholerae]